MRTTQPPRWNGLSDCAGRARRSGGLMGKHSDGRGLPELPFPIDDPLAALPATPQRILAAVQRLLSQGGYDEVTLEKVAAEAGVNKASIRYNFADKAGLLAALVDVLMHAEFARMAREAPGLRHEQRLEATLEAKRRMILSSEAFRVSSTSYRTPCAAGSCASASPTSIPGGASRTSPGWACRAAGHRTATSSYRASASSSRRRSTVSRCRPHLRRTSIPAGRLRSSSCWWPTPWPSSKSAPCGKATPKRATARQSCPVERDLGPNAAQRGETP